MFPGKINQSNSRLVLNALERIRNGEHGFFTVNASFNSAAVLNQSFVNLEMFWYRVIDISFDFDVETRYTMLRFIKSLAMLPSSSILAGICNCYYAISSQRIVQRLPLPTTNKPNSYVIRRFHRHLHDGTKSDAVTGWLFYASFYYVSGQYNTTLKIIDHDLSRCTPDMIMLGIINYTTDDIKYYKHNAGCSNITLNERMRLATIYNVFYVKHSTLMPHELKPEIPGVHFDVLPVVMSQFLRFLCYHHLYDIVNRQQALRDLYLTIQEMYFVTGDKLSNSLTILGVCNEIVGEKGRSYYCYDAALQSEHRVCPTAARRKVNINMT